MSILTFDFTISLRAYPYITPQTSALPASIATSTALDEFSKAVDSVVKQIAASTTDTLSSTEPDTGDSWYGIDNPGTAVNNIVKQDIFDNIEKGMKTLSTAAKIAEQILKIVQLLMTSFNSVQTALSTLVSVATKTLKDFSQGGLNAGVYLNLIAPPALLKTSTYSPDQVGKLRGGFPAFIGRLQTSVSDPTDPNRPVFGDNDFVGGWVILVDSEKIDDIWESLRQLRSFFTDLGKFHLWTTPPPPNNLNGTCGYYTKDGKKTFAVKVEWDNTYMCSGYLLSRSTKPGTQLTEKTVDYIPETIMGDRETGDPGLLPTIWTMLKKIFQGDFNISLPKKNVLVYSDNPIVVPNVVGKTVTFYDYDIPENLKQVVYVVQSYSGDKNYPGPYSKEVVVTLKRCNDMYNLTDAIEMPDGSFEYHFWGASGIGAWTSIQLGGLIPWFQEFVNILTGMIKNISSWTVTASNGLSSFIQGLVKRVQSIIAIIRVLTYLLVSLKRFSFGPSIYMLKLTPKEGGVNGFIQRIKNAKLPDGETSFSGSNGITIGLVTMYGAGGASVEVFEDAAIAAEVAYEKAAQIAANAVGTPAEQSTANIAGSIKSVADATQKTYENAKKIQIKTMSAAFEFLFKMFPSKKK